ncbi:MAG: DUF3489 domain-containing protein [Rhodospirillales bacterium]
MDEDRYSEDGWRQRDKKKGSAWIRYAAGPARRRHGWQKHTIRSTFAGALKRGLTIGSEKPQGESASTALPN